MYRNYVKNDVSKQVILLLQICFISVLSVNTLSAQAEFQHKYTERLADIFKLNGRSKTDDDITISIKVRNVDSINMLCTKTGIHILGKDKSLKVLILKGTTKKFLSFILPDDNVIIADIATSSVKEEILIPGHNLVAGSIHYVHKNWPLWDGAGQTISIKENRFDTADVDLFNRIKMNASHSKTVSQHATIVATWTAGAGNAGQEGRGVARGAHVVSSDYNGLLPDAPQDYQKLNVKIQNHSYGSEIDNHYSLQAMSFDQSALDNPELLHVFSVGNEGEKMSLGGKYDGLKGFSNLTGSFKMAKNALIVGAVNESGDLMSFSSRGPTYDGRIKPDLVAYGPDGTSGAAALVSGSAAILHQVLQEKNFINPRADLIRTLLIAGAQDIGTEGPDFVSGYGCLDLSGSIHAIRDGMIVEDSLQQGQIKSYDLQLSNEIQKLKIVLSWSDLPANSSAVKALIHDLDLLLTDPGGDTIQPWILDTNPIKDSLSKSATRGLDTLNNIEVISLDNPKPGKYSIYVSARHSSSNQKFSMVAYPEKRNPFYWLFPLKGDLLEAQKKFLIQWKNNSEQNSASVEWQAAGENNWRLIHQSMDLSKPFLWTVPDTICSATLKITTKDDSFVSDTFLISKRPRIEVKFNCKDSILLTWPDLGSNIVFTLWGLGEKYLEPILHTRESQVVLHRSMYNYKRYALSIKDNTYDIKSPTGLAPDPETQGAACYFQAILASRIDGKPEGNIDLRLGSLHGIKKLHLEKYKNGLWKIININDTPTINTIWRDSALHQGLNQYRAVILLQDGQQLLSEEALLWYSGSDGTLVFPNPVSKEKTLNILSESAQRNELQFKLYDTQGKLITQDQIDEYHTQYVMNNILPGIYFLTIYQSDKLLYSGKLIVLP
jgi:hypothetical protein